MLKGLQTEPNKARKIKKQLKGGSRLLGLDPFIDEEGMLRVGGRLKNSSLQYHLKHPLILPNNHVAELIVRWYHYRIEHGGRSATLNEIRSNGYWIVKGNAMVRRVIFKCVNCRRLRGRVAEQKMSDLPTERVTSSSPFASTGIDMFGPFIIKQGRKEVKRYGCLFTCLSSRAVHLEVTNSMDTDSFINALRRVIARRGTVACIRSDNGPEFVAKSVRDWISAVEAKTAHFESISHRENGYCVSFNAGFREEFLNVEIFHTLKVGAVCH